MDKNKDYLIDCIKSIQGFSIKQTPTRRKNEWMNHIISHEQYNQFELEDKLGEEKAKNITLENQIEGLRNELEKVKERLQSIEEEKEDMVFEEIALRSISQKKAKEEIKDYYKKHPGKVYVSDILKDLLIDPEVIMKIISELEDEGIIGVK